MDNTFLSLNPSIFIKRGQAKDSLGDKYGAIADYTEFIRLNPNSAEAFYLRGSSKSDLGDKTGALDDFQKALKTIPEQYNKEWHQKSLKSIAIIELA